MVDDVAIREIVEINPLLPDDKPFFHPDRKNLRVGWDTVLSLRALSDAYAQVSANGGGLAHWLVVPPSLALTAAQILHSLTYADPDGTALTYSPLGLHICPALESATAWLLAASLDMGDTRFHQWGCWIRYSGV